MPKQDSQALLAPGLNCWRIEQCRRATLIIDAADYFHHVRKAMLLAEKQILLIGWDFDTRILLDDAADDGAPAALGSLVSWLARERPQLAIYILRWDWGAPKLLARGSTVFRLLSWARTKQIKFKLDGAHPAGASHHQKIVVIDDKLAFCGGIDMTATRWDTREHRDQERGRRRPTTGRRYRPWHDATMAIDGAAARALGVLARDRWEAAGGTPIAPPEVGGDPWPAELKAHFYNTEVALARTRGRYGDAAEVREIEALYVDIIARVQRYMYVENQFFASRVIAEAIAKRLKESDCPEFAIINPRVVEGWIEEEVMTPARAELLMVLREGDKHNRLRVYTPVTTAKQDIYVHSKICIVDDKLLRVGSANINNRSMGLDSECDVLIDAGRHANTGASKQIRSLLLDLLGEHLGREPKEVESELKRTGSLIQTIETLRGEGRTLMPLQVEQPNLVEAAIANREALDPERAGQYLRPAGRTNLLRRLRHLIS